jgi:hypothetical protein
VSALDRAYQSALAHRAKWDALLVAARELELEIEPAWLEMAEKAMADVKKVGREMAKGREGK